MENALRRVNATAQEYNPFAANALICEIARHEPLDRPLSAAHYAVMLNALGFPLSRKWVEAAMKGKRDGRHKKPEDVVEVRPVRRRQRGRAASWAPRELSQLLSQAGHSVNESRVEAAFTGHLDGAEALYDGSNRNLIGVRNFLSGTPQLAVLLGMTRAGKSAFMSDLLSQTDPYYDFTLPRGARKRVIFEEVARTLDISGGEQLVSEFYAQLSKFSTWIISIVQQYSRFQRSGIRPIVFGNAKQFFFTRMNDRQDIEDVAKDIDLSETTKEAISRYPLPEHLPDNNKYAALTYYHLDAQQPRCGTIHNRVTVFFYLSVSFVAGAIMKGASGTTSALQAGIQGTMQAAGLAVGAGITAAGATATFGGSAAVQGALAGTQAATGAASAAGRIASDVVGSMGGSTDIPPPPPVPTESNSVANADNPAMTAYQTASNAFAVVDNDQGTVSHHRGNLATPHTAQAAFNSHASKAQPLPPDSPLSTRNS